MEPASIRLDRLHHRLNLTWHHRFPALYLRSRSPVAPRFRCPAKVSLRPGHRCDVTDLDDDFRFMAGGRSNRFRFFFDRRRTGQMRHHGEVATTESHGLPMVLLIRVGVKPIDSPDALTSPVINGV